jgi:hypothetical protein
MDFPDGESVEGQYDIRGRFDRYIGGYPIKGKTFLDVGTASGFLAFSAEAAGAIVTATELKSVSELSLIPFKENNYYATDDLQAWEAETDAYYNRGKNAFWYAWHKYRSQVTVSYTPLQRLRYTSERFDVVNAGAILEHLSDPVSAIGTFTRLAKEAVIIPFTPVLNTEKLIIRPFTDFANPVNYFTWWSLSRGMFRRIFLNCGFEIELVNAGAYDADLGVDVKRPTIVARRTEKAASQVYAPPAGLKLRRLIPASIKRPLKAMLARR